MQFKELMIGQIFTESETTEYYMKVSGTTALVYDNNEKVVHIGTRFGEIEVVFPQTHKVVIEN